MKKRTITIFGIFLSAISIFIFVSWSVPKKSARYFYQLTVYQYSRLEQEKMMDNYLQKALLPALHRMKIDKAGVFKAIANDTSDTKTLYVLIPFSSLDMVTKVADKLAADKTYQDSGAEYINAPYTAAPYNRIETILLKSFHLAPELKLPALNAAKKERVYELRSYESATEKIFRNKVHMFNEGDEIGLFARLNFNAIFYSEVIAGSKMPDLMYMTSFESMKDRDEHWKSFVNDPYWKKLSSMPEYQKNVSHIDITLLRPVDYSDF
jgi:NIPSNAP